MIEINLNKINKSFGTNHVLNDIDITVKTGEKIGLIGSNGSGKSTILKLISGIEKEDSGNISIKNGSSIGFLEQLPSIKDINVKEFIYGAFEEIIKIEKRLNKYEESLLSSDYSIIEKYTKLQDEFINKGGYEYKTKIDKILSAFGITDEMLNRNFNTLSGGEKTILSLIKLLLQEPDILLLDEPTNHLDIKRVEWLEKFLNNYKKTVIVVSHDRYFLDNVVNKIFLITKRGIEVYHGNYTYFIKENENRLMIEFKNYKNQQKQIEAMEKSIKRLYEYGRLCGDSGGEIFYRRAASIKKRLEKMDKLDKPEEKKNLPITFENVKNSSRDVIKANKLDLSISGKELLNRAKFDLFYGERVCIIGENGCGKSTLIKEILKGNTNIKLGANVKIGYIPQEINFDDDNITVMEEARKYFIGYESNLRAALFKYLFAGENIYKKIKYLSGGEKVRLKLFCLIQDSYNFLILDEPTNHIDIDTREMLEQALKEFNGTILFVSHDRYFINKIATHIMEIKDKKITKYLGNYDDYINLTKI